MRLLVFSLSAALLMTGCALPPAAAPEAVSTTTDTQNVQKTTSLVAVSSYAENEDDEYQARIQQVARDIRAVCTAPANQPYYEHTPCLPSGMTEKHLRNAARPSAPAPEAAKRVFANVKKMNAETRALMTLTGNPALIAEAQRSRQTTDPKIEALQNTLLSGTITWGDYNRARLEIFEAGRAAR